MVPYSALTDYDRSVVLTLDDRPDPQLWGHSRSTHNSSMICFFCVFAVVSLWHPGDGRDVRKKPLPYNYFSLHCFKGFSVASWRIMQHVIKCLTVSSRFVIAL